MIVLGIFMILELKTLQWKKVTELIPSLVMLLTIPMTMSIYRGFAFGFMAYVFLKGLKGEGREVHPVCWAIALTFAVHLSVRGGL
jgi:AGZA family xanthine/uracil permease-like MFS transporter